jgi:pyruvate, water dikinase
MSTTHPLEPVTAPQTRLRRLDQLGKGDVAFAGGKGANLGELRRAGVPVPDGFVIGAPAYAVFCDAGDMRDKIRRRLEGLDVEDSGALAEAANAVREVVLTSPVPDEVAREIRLYYTELMGRGACPVAVRSSATAEDTAEASFAGMNETFLHVLDVDALLGAVRRCWASLFGARTIYYRRSEASRRRPWTLRWSSSARCSPSGRAR